VLRERNLGPARRVGRAQVLAAFDSTRRSVPYSTCVRAAAVCCVPWPCGLAPLPEGLEPPQPQFGGYCLLHFRVGYMLLLFRGTCWDPPLVSSMLESKPFHQLGSPAAGCGAVAFRSVTCWDPPAPAWAPPAPRPPPHEPCT
jgi:hypothetical protein